MNKTIKPKKIKKGSHIRIIAPARSLGLLSEENKKDAIDRLENFGFKLSFGKNVNDIDEFYSSSIEARINDIHDAFKDEQVDAILTVIGGYNSNQLLEYIDYKLIEKNPKIICGFSDITALGDAITSKTGMITYMGPHFSSWAMKYGFEYSLDYFIKCCVEDAPYELLPSKQWSDDPWYINQEKREFINNDGYWIINHGQGTGKIVGGHLRCINSLQGTDYWPGFDDSILIIEEDAEINPALFDRQLQSLIHQPDFNGIRGILIGRFQKDTKMTKDLLFKIINAKKELKNIPIIANVDFGHTTPIATIPIGGTMEINAKDEKILIKILQH
jgi:muramoyltetrapeptide carboxypeptidase LdcA involved in peptidoglycan recycling